MAKSQPELFRFYRSNLATIIWDPKNNKPLAEFVGGQFYTEDPSVAEVLINAGYPRVGLDEKAPPDIFYSKGHSLADGENARIMPPAVNEEIILQREQAEAKQKALADKAQAGTSKAAEKSPGELTLEHSAADGETQAKQRVTNPTKPKKSPSASLDGVGAAEQLAKQVVAKTKQSKSKQRTIKRRK